MEDNQLGHGLLTYTVLEALARPGSRGDVDVDSIKITVEDDVPKLSERWYSQRQMPIVKSQANFPFGPPLAAAASGPPRLCEAGRFTVIGAERLPLFTKPGQDAEVLENPLNPDELFQVCQRKNGFALVSIRGKTTGWVEERAIKRLRE